MPLPIIPLAISLAAKFGPSLIGKLAGDKAEETAGKVVEIAQAVTGKDDPSEAATAINANPEIALKFQEGLRSFELAVYQEDTKRLNTINETFRAELTSTDKYNSRWRATFGYSVAFSWTLMFVMVMIAFMVAFFKSPERIGDVANALAELFGSMGLLWGVALSVLGITVHKRSQDKKTAAGDTGGMITGIIQALKK